MDFEKLEKLMELMRKHGMRNLKIEDKDLKVQLSTSDPAAAEQPYAPMVAGYPGPYHKPPAAAGFAPVGTYPTEIPPPPDLQSQAREGAGEAKPTRKSTEKTIKSPFVGTFYEAPAPGADPFVSVGQRVKKGDVLCIVEAMKLMNEIEAEFDGVIKEILVENEEPVEFDQPLYILE